VAGTFTFDGRTRGYRRGVEVAEAEIARIRLSRGVGIDTSLLDNGDGVLVWATRPEASDTLRAVIATVRDLVGTAARPLVYLERSGWSPKQLAELVAAGFDVLAHGNGRVEADDLLTDREVHIGYESGRRRFSCRQITRLDSRSGHQTQILATRRQTDAAALVQAVLGDAWEQHDELVGARGGGDAVRIAVHNAEHALTRSLAARHAGDDRAARGVLREAIRSPADVRIESDALHVRLGCQTAPGSTRAIAALCEDLTATATRYPGTDLTLVYSIGINGCS
jgi:hypothetical protein